MSSHTLYELEQYFKDALSSIDHPLNGDMRFDTPKWQQYKCSGSRKSKTTARYKVHSDGTPVLKFNCPRCGIKQNFFYKSSQGIKLTPAQYKAKQLQDQKLKKEREIRDKDIRTKAYQSMIAKWEDAIPCTSHNYFVRKKIQDVLEADDVRIDRKGNIINPIRLQDGTLISTQTISANGKFFHSDLSIKDGFHILLPPLSLLEEHDEIYFGEGLATCLTIRNIVCKPVIVCYGKRFHEIAPILAKQYPNKQFIYCCDHPSKNEKYTSESSAQKAIALVGGRLLLPDFSELKLTLEERQQKGISDFNDLYVESIEKRYLQEEAFERVRFQLTNEDICMKADYKDTKYEQFGNEKVTDNILPFNTRIQKEEYPDLIDTYNGGKKPLNTYGNLKYMLDRLGIVVRWNDMARIREVIIPNSFVFYDDEENSTLREITNLAEINYLPTTKINDHLDTLAQKNHYHPIVECIKSKPWDGVERVDEFIRTIKTKNEDDLSHMVIYRWMISAIAAVFSKEGFSAQGILVLQGKQNLGKTRWVKALDPINCRAVKEGALLDPANKDTVRTCASHWIVELGELDGTFRQADIARLKSFTTNEVDILRFPFARKDSRLPRRTVFIATVNESRYLIDDTGNRRWWTIAVERIDMNHGLDMQQIWAEIYHQWINGEQTWLTQDELNLITNSNMEHEQIDPLEEKVLDHFDWSDGWQKSNTLSMSASEVLREIGYDKPNRALATHMGSILTKITEKAPYRRKHTLPRIKPSRVSGCT